MEESDRTQFIKDLKKITQGLKEMDVTDPEEAKRKATLLLASFVEKYGDTFGSQLVAKSIKERFEI